MTNPMYYILPNQTQYIESWNGMQSPLMSALENYTLAHENENGTIRQEIEAIKHDYPDVFKKPAIAVKTNASEEFILQSLDFSQGPWTNAKPFSDFLITPSKQQPPVETKVRLIWDDRNLYVGYENFDSDMASMVYNDSVAKNWWNGSTPDSVETFIGDVSAMYKGFFSNVNNVKFAFKMGVNPPTGLQGSPESVWKVNSKLYGDRWNTVQAIPFETVNIDPEETSSLTAFFLRNYHGQHMYISWGGGNTWTANDFNVVQLTEDTEPEQIWVMAVNGAVKVTLPVAVEPSIGDFAVQRIVNNGSPEPVTAAPEAWDSSSKTVTLSVPAIPASETDQAVVYRVSYKGGEAVDSAPFVIAAGLEIVKNGQAKAVIVVPQMADNRIPDWKPTHTSVTGKVKVTNLKHSGGQYSLHINDDDGMGYGLESNHFGITGGERYTVTAMTYLEYGPEAALVIYYYDANHVLLNASAKVVGIEGGTTASLTGTAPPDAVYASAVLYADAIGQRSVYFDDVVFKKENGEAFAIGNAGFEITFGGAASTLSEYVRKASGADLPVVTEDTLLNDEESYSGFVRIYVGGFTPTGDPEIDQALASAPNDGFVIKAKENKITIIGPTIAGTENGVTKFLEQYLGVQWASGSEEEVIPQSGTIVIPGT